MYKSTKRHPWYVRIDNYIAPSNRPWHERMLLRAGLIDDQVKSLVKASRAIPGPVLRFRLGDTIPLAKHALSQAQHLPLDVKMPFKVKNPLVWAQTDKLTRANISQPLLHLVCDHGIYLMSNGFPVQRITGSEDLRVAYAVGFDPVFDHDWKHKKQRTIGSSPLQCGVPLEWLAYFTDIGIKEVHMKITRRGVLPYHD